MELSDTERKACPPEAGVREIDTAFELLACGLFPRKAVSVEYTPGRLSLPPSAGALIDRAWQRYLRTSGEAGLDGLDPGIHGAAIPD